MSINLNIGVSYTFNTLAPGILQAVVKNAKLKAVLDYETATKYDNIDLKYRQIYPQLPNGTPDSPSTCQYFLFKSESGENIIMADQWIDQGTIDTVEFINFTVNFSRASLSDMPRVRDALNALGNLNYEMKQVG